MIVEPRAFDVKLVDETLDRMIEFLNDSGTTNLEKVHVVAGLLSSVGFSMYDRKDPSLTIEDVKKDYKVSPSYPAALMLLSEEIHNIRTMFIKEAQDPEASKEAWLKMNREKGLV